LCFLENKAFSEAKNSGGGDRNILDLIVKNSPATANYFEKTHLRD
jgi:hypothetical protein